MKEVEIIPYQVEWESDYEGIASHIRSIVTTNVLRIDHIGSTSIAGMAAKDVIDIQITVTDLTDLEDVEKLKEAGYEFRPNVRHDLLTGLEDQSPELKKLFFHEIPGRRRANIHIRERNRLNQVYPLIFRDYLRSDAIVRDAYQTIKIELAKHFRLDNNSYYDIKDPHMDTIYQAAKLWAKLTGWEQDASFY